MKTLTLFLLLLSADMFGQCENATEIVALPFHDEFCVPQQVQTSEINSFGTLHSLFGCWSHIYNGHWYTLESGSFGGPVTMEVWSDLTNPYVPAAQNVHVIYAVFTDCPQNNGTILSYPCNCNNVAGECWDEFGGNDQFIMSSCIYTNISGSYDIECQAGEPWWNFGGSLYQITFNLEPDTRYYFAVFPPSVNGGLPSYGCVEVDFSGPLLLEIPEPCWLEQSQDGQTITSYGADMMERSSDNETWVEVEYFDRPGPGIWYYRACDRVHGFQVPEPRKWMVYDYLGRRVE